MARNALRTAAQWLKASLSGGATPTVDGGLTITGQNQLSDFTFTDLQPDGSSSVEIQQSPEFNGYVVFASPAGGGRAKLGRQNGALFGPNRKMWTADQPIIRGPRPKLTSSEGQQPAPAFELRKKTYGKNARGFRGGTRLAAVSAVSKRGSHTTLTDPVQFTHSNGQNIKYYLPDEAPDGAHKWGLWLSAFVEPGQTPDPSTLRLQRTIPVEDREHTLTGPRRGGRRAPSTNETYVGRPREPKFGRDAKLKRAPGDLREMTDFALAISEVTPRGESLISGRSRDRSVAARIRKVRKLRRLRDNQQPNENEWLVRQGGKRFAARNEVNRLPRPHRAYWIRPTKTHPDTTRFKVYVRLGGKWYVLIDKKAVNPGAGSSVGSAIPFYGTVENATEGNARKEIHAARRFVLSEATPPEEDASGIEAPTGEIDPPVGIAGASPEPGTYTVTYAPVIGGVIQRAAVPKRITIGVGETFQLIFPPRVNRLVNPAGAERDANDNPINWTYNLTNAGTTYGVPSNATGKVGVRTNGIINDTSFFGPMVTSDSVAVTGAIETLRGFLEVTDYVGGVGSMVLVQYDASGSQVTTSTLASLSRNGTAEFTRTVGPAGSGATLELSDMARSVALRFTCGNASGRNLAVRGHTLALHPFAGSPRNFLFPPEGQPEIADPDPPLETPFPETSVACITRPPKSVVSSPEQARIQSISFDGISGADLPAPWVKNRYPENNNVTLEVSAGGAIRGAKGLRVRSGATQVDTRAFYVRDYPASLAPGDVLAVRASVVIDELPSVTGYTSLFSIGSQGAGFMAQAAFARGGMIYLRSRGAAGVIRARSALRASIGDVVDIEIFVRGGNTSSGDATMLIGINGSQREAAAFLGNNDWRSRPARQVVLGTGTEANTSATYSYRMDDVVISPYGDSGTESVGLDATLPDRPLDVQTPVLSGSGTTNTAISSEDSLWLRAEGTLSSTFAGSPLLTIRGTSAAGLVSDMVRATTTTAGTLRLQGNIVQDTSLTLTSGESHILEIGAEGLTSEAGRVFLYHRLPSQSLSQRRLLAYAENVDLSGVSASSVLVHPAFSTVSWEVYERGEATYRQTDDRNEEINQLYLFVPPGYETAPPQAVLEERILKPGRWTFGVYGKQSFAVESPWVITLKNEAGEQIEPLSCVSTQEPWGEWVVSFDVPPGFERVSAKFRPLGMGMWIFQEPGYFAGEPTASQRASWRNHGKAPGYFEAVLPLGVPEKTQLRAPFAERRVSLDAATDIPGTSGLTGKNLLTANQSSAEEGTTNGVRGGGATIAGVQSNQVDEGSYAFRSTIGAGQTFGDLIVNPIPALTDTTVTAQARVKQSDGDSLNLFFRINASADDSLRRFASSTPIDASGEWDFLTLTEEIANDEYLASHFVRQQDSAAERFMYVDNLQLEYGSEATEWEIGTRGRADSHDYDATLTTHWSYGPSEDGPWTAVDDPDQTPELIEDAPFVKVEGSLIAGGEHNDLAPEIAPAGVSSDYVTELPILLREDGTSLSGGSVVTDLHRPYERPDYTEESVGGHARPVPLTEDIDRIEEGVVVYLFTPEAEAEFARDCLRHDWLLDYPTAGMQLRVRLYGAAERAPLDIPLLEEQTGYIWTSFEVGQLEVMERGVLDQTVAYEDSEGNPE